MDVLNDPAELLRGVPVLAEFDAGLLAQITAGARLVSLAAGEWLFRAGDEARTAYVLISGRLEVVAGDGSETVLQRLRRGAVIGELALLRRGRRAASIRARRDCRLLALDRDQFEELLRTGPGFALALTRAMAEQLARSSAPAAALPPPRTITVVPLDADAPARDAAGALAEHLRGIASVDSLFDPPERPHTALTDAQAAHQHVVLLATEPDPAAAWTGFCLSEGDLIVALTRGHPEPTWLRHAQTLADSELVVLGDPASDQLTDRFKPSNVRCVRGGTGLGEAMSELARRIGGRSVGLVLSGGGARAFAHLGVLAELRRERIRIDRIGGVSLGAVVAALYACGNDPEQVREICMQGFVQQNPTNDFTVPLVSLIRGRKTLRLLHHYLGDVRIEELPVPFFCTSTDLVRREPVVHRTGPLAEAVMASLSIPGVFPPSRDPHGRLLVDGGVLDNLPVRAMNRAAEGPVIAVDVTGFTSADRAPANGRRPAVAAIVRRVVTGSDRRLPRLSETIVRCMTLASSDTVAAARRHADLVIAPEVSGIGMLDWRRLEQMQRAGADAARRALAARPALVASLRE